MYKLNDNDKSLIQTLLFRESYGGMKGDKNMLIDIASIWYQRFINNDMNDLALKYYRNQEAMADQLIYISPPEENLKPSEWILAAIDFHVVNNIIMILADKYETLTYEDIKSAIWHHSSKYTNKINLSANKKVETDTAFNKTQKAWDIIRPEFYSLASYFLKNNH
jgi:hypothetical protein